MKFKSLITTTLALGVIASTGANFNTNEASTTAQPLDKSSSTLHHGHSNIPDSIYNYCERYKPERFYQA
ncbi:hypothetical protein ACVPOS_15820 [Staphylococcus aureus]